MTVEAYEEVQRSLLRKKIDGIFHGLDCITSLNGRVMVFNQNNSLVFKLCGDMLISVPYGDIASMDEVELELSGGKALQVATKAGYEYILHI